MPASTGEPPKRLVGWSKVKLDAGESKEVTIEVDREFLSVFSVERDAWQLIPGDYTLMVGGSSQSLPLKRIRQFEIAAANPRGRRLAGAISRQATYQPSIDPGARTAGASEGSGLCQKRGLEVRSAPSFE